MFVIWIFLFVVVVNSENFYYFLCVIFMVMYRKWYYIYIWKSYSWSYVRYFESSLFLFKLSYCYCIKLFYVGFLGVGVVWSWLKMFVCIFSCLLFCGILWLWILIIYCFESIVIKMIVGLMDLLDLVISL